MAAKSAALARDVRDVADSQVQDEVLVHVRYWPNGTIFSIGEKPQALSEREWLDRLLTMASAYYQVLAGGRGFFRIPRPRFEAILNGLPG